MEGNNSLKSEFIGDRPILAGRAARHVEKPPRGFRDDARRGVIFLVAMAADGNRIIFVVRQVLKHDLRRQAAPVLFHQFIQPLLPVMGGARRRGYLISGSHQRLEFFTDHMIGMRVNSFLRRDDCRLAAAELKTCGLTRALCDSYMGHRLYAMPSRHFYDIAQPRRKKREQTKGVEGQVPRDLVVQEG